MERYRNFIRLEKIKEFMQDGKREAALELAEEIDFSRLKSVADMSTVAEVYAENGILGKARDCYLRIYSKAKTRRTAMQLINLAIRLKDAEQAETYYEEFCRMAPGDFYSHIYRYRINKMEGKSCAELISNLEELKKAEYIDTWAYELAKLYHKAGEREKCIEECNDIEIWFGSGEIVDRAVALRSYYLGELDFNTVGGAADVSRTADEPELTAEPEAWEAEREIIAEPEVEEAEREIMAEQEAEEAEPETMVEPEGEEAEPEIIAEPEVGEAKQEIMAEQEVEEAEPEITEEPSVQSEAEDPVLDEDEQLIYRLLQEEEGFLGAAVLEELEREEKDREYERRISEAELPVEPETKEAEEEQEIIAAESAEPEEAEEVEEAEAAAEEQPDMTAETSEEAVTSTKICSAAELLSALSFRSSGRREIRINEEGYLARFLEEKNTSLEEYFGFFACHEGIRGQIIKNLEILLNPQIKNLCLVVSGGKQSGKTSLIKSVAKLLYQSGCLTNSRLAVTDAMKINRMRLSEKTDVFSGGCLVINEAGRLDSAACKALVELEGKLGGQTAIIITDDRTGLNKLFRDNREMNSVFPNRIHIPSFDGNDLLMLAYYILAEDGYSLTREADTALIQSIQNLARMKPEGLLAETEKKIRSIIDRTEERNAKSYIRQTMEGKVPERNSLVSAEDIVG